MTYQLPTPARPLNIGTRGSLLALAQANEVRDRLAAAFDLPFEAFTIVVIKTTGDKIIDRPLKEIGGKGLFTREIEAALLDGSIDIAVHSMKDMPTLQPGGLLIDTYLPREDCRDAFISPHLKSIAELPEGAIVGTSSLRRRAQVKLRRPDLEVVEFRGNLQTRLKKLDDGVAEATFLAMAGLNRLKMDDVPQAAVHPDDMLPAIAQGAIGVERREDDSQDRDRPQRAGDREHPCRQPSPRVRALYDEEAQTTRLSLAAQRVEGQHQQDHCDSSDDA